jgi:enoyl-CoA hydratase/carnithine racemase
MPYQNLSFTVVDRIATITVNRPDKLNALNDATIVELGQAIDEARAREDVAGVLLTGAGRAFVAGADISELATRSATEARALARRGQEVFRRFETSPKPTVAVVNGFALGAGASWRWPATFASRRSRPGSGSRRSSWGSSRGTAARNGSPGWSDGGGRCSCS